MLSDHKGRPETMLSTIADFCGDESGGTAIEYGLIVGLLAVAIITTLNSVADENSKMWTKIADRSSDAMQNAGK